MTYKDLVREIAKQSDQFTDDHHHIKKDDVELVLKLMVENIYTALDQGDYVKILGLGKFWRETFKGHTYPNAFGRNADIVIPDRYWLKFAGSDRARNRLNQNRNAEDTATK